MPAKSKNAAKRVLSRPIPDMTLNVYDKNGQKIGELNPQEVLKHMTEWHKLKG